MSPVLLSTILLLALASFPRLATASPSDCKSREFYDGSICKPCPNGEYPNYDRTACMSCLAGNYINANELCLPCSYNSYSTKSNTRQCTPCERHEFTQSEGSSQPSDCENCGRNAFPVPRNYDVICQSCDIGRFYRPLPEFGWICRVCPKGTSTKDYGEDCKACKIGSYARLEGQGHGQQRICERCDANSYNDKPMADACKPCPAGSVASDDRTHCVTTCNPRRRDCHSCAPGEERVPGTKRSCKKCPTGTASPFASTTPCVHCSFYFKRLVPNANRDQCICGSGKAWYEPWKKCRKCSGKSKPVDGSCVCPIGKTFSEDKWACLKI